MSSHRVLAPVVSAASLLGVAVSTVPTAQAATTYVTAASAGTKVIGATTYLWGSSNAPVGSSVCSQVALASGWSTSQCSTIKSDHSYAVELTFGKTTPGTYTFHAITRSATGAVTATSPSVNLTRTRTVTTTPVKPVPVVSAPTTGTYQGGTLSNAYTLYTGYNGVKVYLAQKALGMNPGPMDSVLGPITTSKLTAFQKAHGLTANGVIDQATWNALPIAKDKDGVRYPFTIDSWAKTADVMDDAQRDVKVAASISFAKAQVGKPYIWGGTGPIGFDCSGLMLQAVRAGGLKPQNVSNFTDIRPASDLSRQMWADTSEFKHVVELTTNMAGVTAKLQPGDLIFYADSTGKVGHVSMYDGAGKIVNAVGSMVQVYDATSKIGYTKFGVARPF